MNDLKGLRAVVAGAGAIGSVVALHLCRQGAQVVLADPAGAGDNASGVAAGMLAPLLEALLDPAASGHYPLMLRSRDAWPALAGSLPGKPVLDRSGALLQTDDPQDLTTRAHALGAALGPARSLPAGMAATGRWLFTPEDWRLEPRAMLAALHAALENGGGAVLKAAVTGFEDGRVQLEGASSQAADFVVLATGPEAGGWLPNSTELVPIKGQILRFPGQGPFAGPVMRSRGAYLVPNRDGLVVGATMEEGLSDLAIDADAVQQLRAAAAQLFPALAHAPFTASAGIRAATADGLPLAGPSGQPGTMLARGARRNGWLLAPLIAEVIADHLAGKPPSPAARAFDPARFG